MASAIRKILWALLGLIVMYILYIGAVYGPAVYRATIGLKRFETEMPVLPPGLGDQAILVFSKTNGFRHDEAITAANELFKKIAAQHGWQVYCTESGGVFNPAQLRHFKVMVWNNASGDVLTAGQREAFQSWLKAGGRYLGVHAAGDNSHQKWPWYQDEVLKAHFIGHPVNPQFQEATAIVEDTGSPVVQGLPTRWVRTDEWYSFAASPRLKGSHVLITLDERTYQPAMRFPFPISLVKSNVDLRMGADHPVVWSHCVGRGRVIYSAMGHQASAFAEPAYQRLLENALIWETGPDTCADAAP
ncbi:MAG: ThuA domain-containing protein [Proteobacteria bacterium]|nr:ThuA domain-containing protein [Pseudomonadota bacterium]HQR03331.1 ThuA domain-containing protein [Rhodocyclaceae bacterium]